MAKKRHTAEQIISKLREAEVLLAKGTEMAQVCRNRNAHEGSCGARPDSQSSMIEDDLCRHPSVDARPPADPCR